jgi:hypothetical protein
VTPEDDQDGRRYAALEKSVAGIGYFCRGSLQRRYQPCGKRGCRCHTNPPKLHGPYFEWTRKVAGKTVSQRIQPEEVKLLRGWFRNARRLDALLAKMEQLSMRQIQHTFSKGRPTKPSR